MTYLSLVDRLSKLASPRRDLQSSSAGLLLPVAAASCADELVLKAA